jgi:hypothetical protein
MAEGAAGGYFMELWAGLLTLLTGWNYVSHAKKASKEDVIEMKNDVKEIRTDVKSLTKIVHRMEGRQDAEDKQDNHSL